MRLLRRLTILMAGLTGVVAGGARASLTEGGGFLADASQGRFIGQSGSQGLPYLSLRRARAQWASGRPVGQWGCFFVSFARAGPPGPAGPPEPPPTRILHRRQKRIEHGQPAPRSLGLWKPWRHPIWAGLCRPTPQGDKSVPQPQRQGCPLFCSAAGGRAIVPTVDSRCVPSPWSWL